MEILREILDSVTRDTPVTEVLIGTFDTAVVSRAVGISSTFREPCSDRSNPKGIPGAGTILGESALAIARLSLSHSLLEASLGIAALNSLLDPDPAALVEANAFSILTEKGKGKKIGMVGHFPFAKRLRAVAGELRLVQREPWMREEALRDAARELPGCEVVAVTGSSFINHTFDEILKIVRGAYVVVLGPSTPLSPLLFRHGANVLCGAQVTDRETALRCIAQGATFKEVGGVRRAALLGK